MPKEEVLKGGNVNHIVRMANTVRRPLGYWSPNVHELLKHLEQQGYEGAPKFLGIDDSGREILTFIPGEVPGIIIQTLNRICGRTKRLWVWHTLYVVSMM